MKKKWFLSVSVFLLFQIACMIAYGDMISYFTQYRLILFQILYSIWILLEFNIITIEEENAKTLNKFSRAFIFASLISVIGAVYEYRHLNNTTFLTMSLSFIGLFFICAGVLLRYRSITILGKFFTTKIQILDDHKLITNGVYKYLRHPSYLAFLLSFSGTFVYLSAWYSFLFFIVVAFPLYLYRIRLEELVLRKHFGEHYDRYRENSYALIPFIY